jgi:hypothetical protein
LRCAERLAGSSQRVLWITLGEVKPGENNPSICGCIGFKTKDTGGHFLERSIKYPSRIGLSPKFQMGNG